MQMRFWPFCVVLATVGCAQQAAQTAFVKPPQSSLCRVIGRGEHTGAPVAPELTIRSDGNWCTTTLIQTREGSPDIGPVTSLEKGPAHGEVSIVQTQGVTFISYRSTAGYAGSDEFVLLQDFLNRRWEVRVNVLK